MHTGHNHPWSSRWRRYAVGGAACIAILVVACIGICGCQALTNPVADSLPARMLSPELKGPSREGLVQVPLTLLGQAPPAVYRLDAGDVLGVFIEGVLGEANEPLPVHYGERADVQPSVGYPIPVGADGTLSLPFIEPIRVTGMTVTQVQEAVRRAYTISRHILKPGEERILITLVRPREYHVKVFRQDVGPSGGTNQLVSVGLFTSGGGLLESASRRGEGFELALPAYENDVLTALSRSGGLPGTEAVDAIVIERAAARRSAAPGVLPPAPCLAAPNEANIGGPEGPVVRIPLRLPPGMQAPIRPADVILHEGDVVFVEARKTDVFYTAGLLPPGEWILPRDYDLDVVQAIARVHGPMVSGGATINNLSGSVGGTQIGIGFPNPSLLVILRRTCDGHQVRIRVDLNRALRDPSERPTVQPGDVLILQETVGEAIGRYLSQKFTFNFVTRIIHTTNTQGTITGTVP